MREKSRFPPYRSSQYGGFETKGKRGDRCRPQQISVPQSLVIESPYKPVEPPQSLLSRERERGGEREGETRVAEFADFRLPGGRTVQPLVLGFFGSRGPGDVVNVVLGAYRRSLVSIVMFRVWGG